MVDKLPLSIMNQGKYVFTQVMEFLPRHHFNLCVKKYCGNRKIRKLSCFEQFLAMSFGQLTHRESLRDIVGCLKAQSKKLYHLGFRNIVAKSTLADSNNKRSWMIYRDFAEILIKRARKLYAKDSSFSIDLKNTVYAFDSSTIDLCLKIFPWANFRKKKAGIKLHTLIDLRGNIPVFLEITEAKISDVNIFDNIPIESGSFYILDRGYFSTERLNDINTLSAFFIIREKSGVLLKRIYSKTVEKSAGIRCDQTVKFVGELSHGGYPEKLRRIKYYDEETKKHYVFLTNNFSVEAKTIADLYKQRWQVELFFKWVKQHLKIKVFWGQSLNAVYTQIWIAVCAYLLVAILKKELNILQSLNEILQILSVSVFDRTALTSLFQNHDLQKNEPLSQKSLF